MKTAVFAAAVLAAAGAAEASITITAQANGSTTPGLVSASQHLINGDFDIQPNPGAGWTGDGWDETTLFNLNVAADPNFAAFMQQGTVTAATLTITLTVGYDNGPITDLIFANGGFSIGMPQFIQTAGTGSIQFDLLQGWSAAAVMPYLSSHNGVIPMVYADDAVISHAEISFTAVPAPGSAVLGIAGLMMMRRRRK